MPWHLLLLLSALLTGCQGDAKPVAPPPTEVHVLALRPQAAQITTDYPASIEAVQQVEIRARVNGLLQRRLVHEGQPVQKGQPLFELDPQPLIDAVTQAEAALQQARASAAQAERDAARVQRLVDADALSRQELDVMRTRAENSRAAVKAAEAALGIARSQLSYARITAPISGIMGRALLKEGALVSAYTSLLTTVYALDPVYVNFSLSEQELAVLEREHGPLHRQPPPIALLQADGTLHPQTPVLDMVDPAIDPSTGSLGVRLRVPNADHALRPGQFARVRVTQRIVPEALLIPERAVTELQGKHSVWVVVDGKAARRDVQLGPVVGEHRLVLSGLRPGELLVTDSAPRLKPDMPVKAISADSAGKPKS